MRMGKEKWIEFILLPAVIVLLTCLPGTAEEIRQEEVRGEVLQLENVVIKGKGDTQGIVKTPTDTIIKMDDFTTIGVPGTVDDVLKHHAIVDFRAQSDLVPDDDTITLRGFTSNRFVTAIDGLTVQKTGGRKSTHIVDYALLPTFLIESIEILPGPHSAKYDAKSIGGVLNLVTKKPKARDTLKPDVSLTTSYRSYDTQNHNVTVEGSVKNVTYDIAYQKNSTDGYMRSQESDIDTVFGRLGYLLPADGFVTVSGSYTWADRTIPVSNPGTTLDGETDFDGDYPEFNDTWLKLQPWQKPTWDKEAHSLRLALDQPSPIGHITLNAYTSKEDRERAWYIEKNGAIERYSSVTDWWQHGGKLEDEIQWNSAHSTTLGFDLAMMYDDGIGIVEDDKTERINKKGAYLQHQWAVLPSVDLRLGMRYEDVTIWVDNWATDSVHIPGREPKIERNWDELIPKSFVTWKMDGLAPWMRDTSLSAGVSKIWHAPDYHGDYNPQGRPAGAWLDPEYGMGYDLVFSRRLWRDISLKTNYSYCEIKDYIATNKEFALYDSSSYGELAYSDYKINLEEMQRHGLELELDGHVTDDLSFFLTWSWQEFESKGGEPAGEQAQDEQAKNRVSAGLRYTLFEKTTFMLDYYYQGDEVIEVAEETEPNSDIWVFHQVDNPSYNVFDFGIQHTLLQDKNHIKDLKVGVFVKNLFDEEYYEASSYPSTDRTYGVSLCMEF